MVAMANSTAVKLVASCIAIVLWWLLMVSGAEATVTCSEVTQQLSPCVDYLMDGGGIPSDCCDGVKQVKAASSSGEDRRTACTCILDAAAMIPGLDYNLISSLPSQCGVSLPYKISPSTDCSRSIIFYPYLPLPSHSQCFKNWKTYHFMV